MLKKKKHTGKGHTLFEHDPPKDPNDIWILITESCYEISKTLVSQHSYAKEIHLYFSGYDSNSGRGGLCIIPQSCLTLPIELFQAIHTCHEIHDLINNLLHSIRRIQVNVLCEDMFQPLFPDLELSNTENYHLMEKIREKDGQEDIIGLGLEGFRKKRLSTYTAKRSDEIHRARKLLHSNPIILKLLETS
jgi:hypothetical protein